VGTKVRLSPKVFRHVEDTQSRSLLERRHSAQLDKASAPLSDVKAKEKETPLPSQINEKVSTALGPGKVSREQAEDFTSSEGKRNSKIKKKKHESMSR